MCIRDRFPIAVIIEKACLENRWASEKWEAIGVIPAFDAAAVSYTHLRAHETVLDLVCRLLL